MFGFGSKWKPSFSQTSVLIQQAEESAILKWPGRQDANRKDISEEIGGLFMIRQKKCLRIQNVKMQGLGFDKI